MPLICNDLLCYLWHNPAPTACSCCICCIRSLHTRTNKKVGGENFWNSLALRRRGRPLTSIASWCYTCWSKKKNSNPIKETDVEFKSHLTGTRTTITMGFCIHHLTDHGKPAALVLWYSDTVSSREAVSLAHQLSCVLWILTVGHIQITSAAVAKSVIAREIEKHFVSYNSRFGLFKCVMFLILNDRINCVAHNISWEHINPDVA